MDRDGLHEGSCGAMEPEFDDPLRIAERRIAEHPGYKEHVKLEGLRRTITDVFSPNLVDLLSLLDRVATDQQLAFEMVQNVREPIVRAQYQAAVNRCLHNYLASVKSLIDHSTRIMRGRTGLVADEFERRKATVVTRPDFCFVRDLRNFVLHRSLPALAHRVTWTNVNTADARLDSEVELSVKLLSEWDGWSAPAKQFLAQQEEVVRLRPTVRDTGGLIYELNAWLHDELIQRNADALAEVDHLIVVRNAALAGTDIETARRLTDRSRG
jgi:hypothetical protein